MNKTLLIFLKGILMGICDVIPGISGGTIAFITGIYERLIKAIKSATPEFIFSFIKYTFKKDEKTLKKAKKQFKALDLPFLLPLIIGIGLAVFAGAHIIPFLLEKYYTLTMLFFVGLIIASCKIIFDNIETHRFINMVGGLFGAAFGILIANLIPGIMSTSLTTIFISGVLAISAMILPGISGSYILLILGQYEFMLNALRNISTHMLEVLVFILGAIVGLVTSARIINYFFKAYHNGTLYFLLGLVLGSLSGPLKIIYIETVWTTTVGSLGVILFAAGILAVLGINHLAKR